jgi:predicted RNase H-like HicB family nuclease
MSTYTAVSEHCPDTKLYVGYVPGFPGVPARAQHLASCIPTFAK